jgi:hypothetical protein
VAAFGGEMTGHGETHDAKTDESNFGHIRTLDVLPAVPPAIDCGELVPADGREHEEAAA